ncbi:hypothetical protein [Coraliomargarita akajimensis]|nr:hypothetical protein [Coraliomargarita akajimensis]
MLVLFVLFSVSFALADEAVHYVQPIEWRQFDAKVDLNPESALSSKLIANAARHSLGWAESTYQTSENGDRYLIPNENIEHTIRPATSAAYGLAVALKTGIPEQEIGFSEAVMTERTLKLIKGSAAIHRVNGGKWGWHWQSSLWSAQLARAAWMLWDELDTETQEMVAKLIENEAQRDYTVRYWNGQGGDSKAEENSWDSMILQVAVAMMPEHPKVESWKTRCSHLMVASYCRPSDRLRTDISLDGKTPADWLDGYNIREDGIVINHNLIHNDYMASIANLQMQGFMLFPLAGQTIPEAIDFNFDLVYHTLATKQFDAPPFLEPGGTMYIPNSPEQYYPRGTDWSTFRYACFYAMDALADVFGYDKDLEHKAAHWRKLRGERILEMQQRHADGRMYATGEFDNYKGAEQMVFWMMADVHLLQWLMDQRVSFETANWLSH